MCGPGESWAKRRLRSTGTGIGEEACGRSHQLERLDALGAVSAQWRATGMAWMEADR